MPPTPLLTATFTSSSPKLNAEKMLPSVCEGPAGRRAGQRRARERGRRIYTSPCKCWAGARRARRPARAGEDEAPRRARAPTMRKEKSPSDSRCQTPVTVTNSAKYTMMLHAGCGRGRGGDRDGASAQAAQSGGAAQAAVVAGDSHRASPAERAAWRRAVRARVCDSATPHRPPRQEHQCQLCGSRAAAAPSPPRAPHATRREWRAPAGARSCSTGAPAPARARDAPVAVPQPRAPPRLLGLVVHHVVGGDHSGAQPRSAGRPRACARTTGRPGAGTHAHPHTHTRRACRRLGEVRKSSAGGGLVER